jgi:hypothetical protein
MCGSRRDERFSGEDIVGDGGQGLFFNKRNVLVGGGVEDKVWAVEREDFVEETAIGGAAEIEIRAGGDGGEILLEIVEAVFRGFEENGVRPDRGQTESERRADGAPSACDEDWVLKER